VGRVLLEKADTHYWHDSNEAALAAWQRALTIFLGCFRRPPAGDGHGARRDRPRATPARPPDVAKKLTSLANTLHRAGRDDEAIAAAADAVRIYHARGESVLPDLAEALENLGLALAGGGRLAEAEAPLQESLALRRRIYGQEHPVVLDAFNSWASLLERQGRIAEALPLRRETLAVARRVLLPGGDLATHINNLAILCYRSGDWACAEAGFREALGLWRTEYGEGHPHVATARNNLGMALMEHGLLGAAEAEVAAALALRRARSGEESVEVAISSRNIGLIHLRQGRLRLARTELDHAVELARRVYEPRHPRLAEALIARADLALAEKRRNDAVAISRTRWPSARRSSAATTRSRPGRAPSSRRLGAAEAVRPERSGGPFPGRITFLIE
jgi:tetratricopeptide (TPR) repeat protein